MQALTKPPDSPTDAAGPSLRVPLWLFVTLASLWGALVLGNHFVELPVPWSLAVDDGAQALSAARGMTLDVALEHVAVLACVLLILVAAVTVGRGLLALLRVNGLHTGERLLFSVALGLGALSYAMVLLTALGQLSAPGAWVAVGSLAAVGIAQSLKAPSTSRKHRVVEDRPRPKVLDRIAIGALLAHTGVTLLGALTPLIFYDSLAYHFSAPHLSMLNGRLMPMPENLLAQMPATAGYLYALAALLKNEIAAKVLCWLFGVGVAGALGLFARRMSWRGTGLWGALIFWTLFHVSQSSAAGGIDLLLTFFSVCSAYAFFIWLEAERRPDPQAKAFPLLLLSAILSGLAMATKYTGAVVPAALVVTLLGCGWRSRADAKRILKASLCLGLVAALVVSPWLIKNAVLFGNPVAPFLTGVFSNPEALQLQSAQAFTAEAAQSHLRSLPDYLALPWNITMGSIENSAVFSPLFLLLCPLLLLFKPFPRSLRHVAFFTGIFALGWILTSTQVRFLMPVLPWACLLIAYWATHARLRQPLRLAIKTTILACCLAGSLASWAITFSQGGWRVVLGAQDKQDYLSHSQNGYRNPPYPLYRWIDTELPATARVLLFGETRGYYLHRDFVASSAFNKPPLLDWAEKSSNAEELAKKMSDQGITHVLLNPAEAGRLRPYGILETTVDGKRTLQEFWARHVRQVAFFDEFAGDQFVNRLTLYAISPLGTETDENDRGALLPSYMAELLETP